MLSGRSTVVAASGSRKLEIVLAFCRKRLNLAVEGATLEVWHSANRVPGGVRVDHWPGVQPRGEISEYQLLLRR
eukprot:259412-Amphidinium_carterae.1